jgi:formate-dependent nitrite reductase membrane component NrfD
MVPRATFDSYYGRPVIKEPVWKEADVAGYLFFGGLAGASSALAGFAQLTGNREIPRVAKVTAAGAIGLSAVALVHDLGRPSRFLNMLRVFKPTSPMSMGSWLLAAYGPASGVAAASSVTGLLPGVGAAATAGSTALGPAIATYTAALVCNTAVPAWHDGYREMPFLFAGSAASAAGGLAMLAVRPDCAGPAVRFAAGGAAVELTAKRLMMRRLGATAEPYHTGRAGRLLQAAEALTAAGAAGAVLAGAVPGRRRRPALALAGAALLAGSALTRFGVFEAGLASARDPKYTVDPQRARLRDRPAPPPPPPPPPAAKPAPTPP